MCVRGLPCCAVLLERGQRGALVRPPLARRTVSSSKRPLNSACRDRARGPPAVSWSNGKPIRWMPFGVGEHGVRRVLQLVVLRLDRERLPHRRELARGCPAGTPSGPVMPCLSRNEAARLGVSLAGSTEMPTTLDVLAVEVVERAPDRLHLRRARVLGRSSTRTRTPPAWPSSCALVTVVAVLVGSVKSGTGWPGGRIAPAQPLALSSSPPAVGVAAARGQRRADHGGDGAQRERDQHEAGGEPEAPPQG